MCTKTQATTQSPRGHLPAAQPWKVGGAPLTPAQLVDCVITGSDLEEAVRHVQPSVRREGFTTAPDVAWDDVGSLEQVRVTVVPPCVSLTRFVDLSTYWTLFAV